MPIWLSCRGAILGSDPAANLALARSARVTPALHGFCNVFNGKNPGDTFISGNTYIDVLSQVIKEKQSFYVNWTCLVIDYK